MPHASTLPNIEPQLTARPVHPGTRIGHVHLKVANLDRALAFYCGMLGFALTQRYGRQAAFVAAGGYHHHIGLNTWESEGGAMNDGTVIFKPIDADNTEIELHMNYDPEGFKEQVGGALGFVSRRVSGDLERFKEFIETRGVETGGWRDEIIHGANSDETDQLNRKDYDASMGSPKM